MNTLQPFQITNGIIRDFSFDVLNPNITNSTDSRVPIVITAADPPVILAQITIDIPEKKNAVWLFASLGFSARSDLTGPAAIFRIWRGHPSNDFEIFSTADNGQGSITVGTFRNSSFTTVDQLINVKCSRITYYLTVESNVATQLTFNGPISFIAVSI
ncbi:MAG: hypothetical protein GX198_02765 [Epulopiscium sp.]|nr:hypothetical protein [Candidatus Epulonipiscium sp.]HOQ17143.1 hypothetical protein [Defluviitaleaceae bacterium]HPT76516.1 hypothetical protein [Defluviitaleaceae bacterium]